MRIVLAGLTVLIVVFAHQPAEAQPSSPTGWCAIFTGRSMGGSKNCSFRTFEQCQMTVSGIGGFCQPNAFGPQAKPRKTRRVRTQ